MELFHPELAWALPFGAVPVLIYYLMRFRSQQVTWGADYVLRRALERLKKKIYLDQLLLLATRVILCLLLVLAFARLVSPNRAAIISASGIHRIVILDPSASMEAEDASGSRWERSLEALKRLSATWGRGERWSLCLAEETPRWLVQEERIESAAATAFILNSLRPGEGCADLPRALAQTAQRFSSTRTELYLFADDQALTWEGMEDFRWPGATPPPIYWFCSPLANLENLAVTSVLPGSEVLLARHPAPVFVKVRNFGAEAAVDIPVEFLVNGTRAGQEMISLLPGQEGEVRLDLRLDTAGSHRITARLGADVLTGDNELGTGVEVRDKLRAVILRDAGAGGKFDSSWPLLEVLARTEAARDSDQRPLFTLGTVEFTLAAPGELGAYREADVILIDGGCRLTSVVAQQLQSWVEGGRGLILLADERVDGAVWNQHLGSLLPAPLGALRVEALEGERYQVLSPPRFATGMLKAFQNPADGDLAESRFYAWHELGDPVEKSDVLARFEENLPFLVRRRTAPGAVLLLAAGLNSRSNNLMVRETAVPFIFRLLTQAAEGTLYPRTVGRGEAVKMALAFPGGVRAVTFNGEGEPPLPLTPFVEGNLTLVSAPNGQRTNGLCSILLVTDEGNQRVWFGVQGSWPDSDLTPVSAERAGEWGKRQGVVRVKTWEELDESLQASRQAVEYYPWCVAGVILLLLVEMFLARRFA